MRVANRKRRCRTYIQVYFKELAGHQGEAGHGVLDTAQQTQWHQCWGQRRRLSGSHGVGVQLPLPAAVPPAKPQCACGLCPVSESSMQSHIPNEQCVPLLGTEGPPHHPHPGVSLLVA